MCHRAISAAILLFAASVTPAQDSPPNLLVILADDMGYGDLGCFGSKQIETPVLDRLAAAGVRCTQGYVCASVCAPSRAGLLTGRYPQHFGFEHNLGARRPSIKPEQHGLDPGHRTLGDYLSAAGYRTGLIGKWHVGQAVPAMHPNRRGFAHFFGMLGGSHGYFPKVKKNRLEVNGRPIERVPTPYLTDWFTDDAIAFTLRRDDDRRPWFLFLSYNTPHTPLQAKKADLARFAHIPHAGRRTYAAMQWSMDENIGRLLASLEQSGQAKNTLVVFFSDNGGSVNASHALNAPLRGMKGTFFEGGIRVPWIFRWLGRLPAGSTFERTFHSLDLLPTLLAAAGEPMPTEFSGRGKQRKRRRFDGVNLLPFLRGEITDRPPHETLFWRMSLRAAAVRHGNWKLHLPVHQLPMLHDLAADPSEQRNLFRERPKKARELLERLNAWQESLEGTPRWHERVRWQRYNRKLYERSYRLTQPARHEDYSGRTG